MPKKIIQTLLEKITGLSDKAIVPTLMEKAFQNRMSAVNIKDMAEYALYLSTHQEEIDELIELLAITETWFFRNEASFEFLKNHVQSLADSTNNNNKLRILSIPCSTGEEPYSIVMTLLNMGIKDFHVDAVDISERVIRRAGTGIYLQGAFRGKMIEHHRHFFRKNNDYYKILTSVKSNVHFRKGNILDEKLLKNSPAYDIIFCRNLLIYFSDPAKHQALKNIDQALGPKGILFLGHAEHEPLRNSDFEWIAPPRAFACQRKTISKIPADTDKNINMDKKLYLNNNSPPDIPVRSQVQAKPRLIDNLSKPLRNTALVQKEKNLLKTACLLADRGSLDEAFKKCNEYLNKNPADVHAHFLMGMIYQSVENYQESEKFLNKTIYLAPDHCDAMEQLALIAEHRGESAKSKQLRQRIRRILERKEKH